MSDIFVFFNEPDGMTYHICDNSTELNEFLENRQLQVGELHFLQQIQNMSEMAENEIWILVGTVCIPKAVEIVKRFEL